METTLTRVFKDTKKHILKAAKKRRLTSAQYIKEVIDRREFEDNKIRKEIRRCQT